jgi:two-component system response regulator MprA
MAIHTPKTSILVVDRDPHVRELAAHFLNQAGYFVEFATDGPSALERARALHPDVVITEILLPKVDGLALCRELKRDPATRSIAVLVFSILAAEGHAREAGADAFLMKPLGERRFLAAVEEILAARARAATGEKGVGASQWSRTAGHLCRGSAPGTQRSMRSSGVASPPTPSTS